ncbi:MAG: hypothetical protein HY740_03780 [Chloroflexi bacterium]|nr:hypothetical protein [Chloroflexota bacterium]
MIQPEAQISGIGTLLIVTGAIILLVTIIAYFSNPIRQLEKLLPDYIHD